MAVLLITGNMGKKRLMFYPSIDEKKSHYEFQNSIHFNKLLHSTPFSEPKYKFAYLLPILPIQINL